MTLLVVARIPGPSERWQGSLCRFQVRGATKCCPTGRAVSALRPISWAPRGSTLHTLQVTVALVIREYDNSKHCSSLVILIHGTRASGGGMCRDASPD